MNRRVCEDDANIGLSISWAQSILSEDSTCLFYTCSNIKIYPNTLPFYF
jgi:hypothetical protein